MTRLDTEYRFVPMGGGDDLPATVAEVERVTSAWRRTVAVLEIEEKFNLFAENYGEYERDLLNLSLQHMLFRDFQWTKVTDEIYLVNRRLANLLTSTRLYLDQVPHDFTSLFGRNSSQLKTVREQTHTEYDAHFAYRAMEGLRNFAQHRGLPIDKISYPTSTKDGSHGVRVIIGVEGLGDPIKPAVLREFRERGSDVEVTPLVREYVASLSRVHRVVRAAIHSDRQQRTETLVGLLDRCVPPGRPRTVSVYGKRELLTVFEDLLKRLDFLVHRNSQLEAAPNYHVSGKLVD